MQIIYIKTKSPVSIGDKIKIDNITITITQQFIDDNKDMFEVIEETRYWKCIKEVTKNVFVVNKIYKLIENKTINDRFCFINEDGEDDSIDRVFVYFTPSTEQEYLLQVAKEKYPVGCKVRSLCDDKTHTVCHVPKWWNDSVIFTQSFVFIYQNGQWAEILKPILTTEDGKELYEGDSYWFCGTSVSRWSDSSMTNYKPYFVKFAINKEFAKECKFFSTKEACQEYIDKHKEKTLEDYEFKLSMQYNNSNVAKFVAADFIQEMKNLYPELYWYKVALLIRDDLNGDWKVDWNNDDYDHKYTVIKIRRRLDTIDYKITQCNAFYFKSAKDRDKFITLMGDKINYLF
jgi:hypothetical protein